MNKSRYVIRPIDSTDRAIIAALFESGRMTIKKLATRIDMSSPSVSGRILKLEDAGAILGYAVIIDPKVFGLNTAAHVRIRAFPGEMKRIEQLLCDTPQVIEAERVSGDDGFVTKVVVKDEQELQAVIDRFLPFASTDVAIILSSTVTRRLPKLCGAT